MEDTYIQLFDNKITDPTAIIQTVVYIIRVHTFAPKYQARLAPSLFRSGFHDAWRGRS